MEGTPELITADSSGVVKVYASTEPLVVNNEGAERETLEDSPLYVKNAVHIQRIEITRVRTTRHLQTPQAPDRQE